MLLLAYTAPGAALLISLLVVGCAAHSQPGGGGGSWQTRFPAPRELQSRSAAVRASSACESVVHAGAAYDLGLPLQNVAPGLGGAMFSPATVAGDEFNTMAFAIYGISAAAYSGPSELRSYWDGPLNAGDLWLGLANFSANHWDWFNPSTPATTNVLDFGLLADHRNAVGTLFVAVVLLGTEGRQLSLLRLGPPDICGEPSISPQASFAPTLKTIDISSVYVDGEVITACDWDFGDDGSVDASGLGPQQRLYSSSGEFPLRLSVQTNLGDAVSAVFTIEILEGSWDKTVVGSPADSLHHFSSPRLALVDGLPALACIEKFDGDMSNQPYQRVALYFADDRAASAWHFLTYPRSGEKHSRVYSLIDAGGTPVVFAANADGLASPAVLTPQDETLLNWGSYTFAQPISGGEREGAMAMVGGTLMLAVRDNADRILMAYNDGPALSDWSSLYDTGWTCTQTLSLAEVNGYPALATSTFFGSQEVHYLLSSSPTGQPGTWLSWYSDLVYSGTPSLAYINGAPVLASDGSLEFYLAVGPSPDGKGTWHSGSGGANGVGDWVSLAGPCLDAFAVAASQNENDQSLWFTMFADDGVNIIAGNSGIDAEAGVDLGANCDLLVVDGVPVVAYEDRTNDAVKVAVMR